MKMVILGILFLFVNNFCFSQSYHIKISASNIKKGSAISWGCGSGCLPPESEMNVKIRCSDGTIYPTTLTYQKHGGFGNLLLKEAIWETLLPSLPISVIVSDFYFEDSQYPEEELHCLNRDQEITITVSNSTTTILREIYKECLDTDMLIESRPLNTLIAGESPKCLLDSINLTTSDNLDGSYYHWVYRRPGEENWNTKSQFYGNNTISATLHDFSGFKIDEIIEIAVNYAPTIYSNPITISFIGCSPTLLPNLTTTKNTSCFGSNNGSVTLTFDKNVDEDNGYRMRYFVFDEEADLTFDPIKENPPQAIEQEVLDQLIPLNDGTGNYKGTLPTGLGKGLYKIVYQEFFDAGDGTDAIVKSGGVTMPFEIKEPTQIIPSANITQAQCSENEAAINFSVAGGTNLEVSGTYTYLYELNGDGNWIIATGNPERVPTTTVDQSIRIKAIYSIGNCESEAVSLIEKINAIVPPLTFTNPSSGTTVSNSSMDGFISINYDGGTPMYSFQLAKLNEIGSVFEDIPNPNLINNALSQRVEFRDLGIGTYRITIIDRNGCFVTTENLGDISVSSAPLPIVGLEKIDQITCPGASNGSITVHVSGGVMDYNYQWTINHVASPYKKTGSPTISMNNISEPGEYILKIASRGFTDFNDPSAYVSTTINLIAPKQVVIQNASVNNITCYGAQDGNITITPSGGTSYQYKLDFFDPWTDLITNTIPINAGGFYDIYLRNGNGCEATPILDLLVEEPEGLMITEILHTNPSSIDRNDGEIDIILEGGTPPYSYLWTGPDKLNFNTKDVVGLAPGDYHVTVTDENGCSLSSTYVMEQPDIVKETIVPISCFGQNDGSITILVNQGDGIFDYTWNTGATTNIVSDLKAGNYTVTIKGLESGPITRTYIIDEPLPLTVNLGGDKTLCAGQVLELDATVEDASATYSWTSDNGFTSPEPIIHIMSPGNYSVTVSNPTDCSASGSVFVDVSPDEISAELAISSQIFAGETLVAVDISYPIPEMVEWIVPENASVKAKDGDELELWFDEPGEYEIGLVAKRGLCEATQIKKVLVLEKDLSTIAKNEGQSQKRVNDFIIYPNPANGKFTADISLNEVGEISLKIFSFANNTMIDHKKRNGGKAYNIPFDLLGAPSGVYAVLLETPYGNALRKVVLK